MASIYKHIQQLWGKPKTHELWKERLIEWRRDPATVKIKRPTRLDRARAVGYKPKLGVIVVRQRVQSGPHKRPWIGGRAPRKMRIIKSLRKGYQLIAEERASKKFPNCEVLNSYWVAKDGKNYWFEVILVDRKHPVVHKDKKMASAAKQRGRVSRGKTRAGRKTRGLQKKGKGVEKARPSRRANKRLQ